MATSQDLPAAKGPTALKENPDVQIREVEGMGRGLFWCPSDGRVLSEGEFTVQSHALSGSSMLVIKAPLSSNLIQR
jgi:hypothetical protein